MRSLYAWLALAAGCAQGTAIQHDVDASVTPHIDSSFVQSDSSSPGPDSGGGPCTVGTYDILINGNFEQMGTGWTVTPITAGDPLINTKANDGGGVDAQSPAYRAWLGGVNAPTGTVTDSMYQDVAVPDSTTALKFTGYYWTTTQEFTSGVFDTAKVELQTSTGALIQSVKTFDDDHTTSGWTAFSKTFTSSAAGSTVRLFVSSTNETAYPTNFYFDTFVLSATYCK